MALQRDTEVGHRGLGNTMPGRRARGFCITIFKEDDLKAFNTEDCRYKIAGREVCPDTGREHMQCYIYYDNARSFKTVKRKFPRSHIEIGRGTAEQNREYCSKDGDFQEAGEMPHQGKKISADDLVEMTDEQIIEMDMRCHKAYINAKRKLKGRTHVDDWFKDVKVYWIQGASGSGKSMSAMKMIKDLSKSGYFAEIQYVNNFWNINDEDTEVALYDDFRDSHCKPSEFIKFIDYNRHTINVKGGHMTNNYTLIIFTSVQRLKDIYRKMKDQEPKKQWERRIEVIDLYDQNEHRDLDDQLREEEDSIDLSNFK